MENKIPEHLIMNLPEGTKITPLSEILETQTVGSFWDYCSDWIIDCIGLNLFLAILGLAYLLWKFAIFKIGN